MCIITGRSKVKTATGYKVAVKRDGKYYSFWTNMEYKSGIIDAVYVTLYYVTKNDLMQGQTGVFTNKKHAKLYLNDNNANRFEPKSNSQLVLLEMKLGNIKYKSVITPLVKGHYARANVLIGSKILSIEECSK